MKTVTQKINLYEWHELSEEVQKKVLDSEIQNAREFYCEYHLSEDMEEKAKELLNKYFKEKGVFKNIAYSLNYCQGDGAMIEFDLQYYNNHVSITHEGHYNHEYSFRIYETGLTSKQYSNLKEKIICMNKDLTKAGYGFIEQYLDDCSYVIEDFHPSGTLYTESGEIWQD